jgi:hypothetical protein
MLTVLHTRDTTAVLNAKQPAFALRGGQVIDMLQTAVNSGMTLPNIQSKNLPDAVDEITGLETKADSALDELVLRLRQYVEQHEAEKYEGIIGFF